MRLIKEGLVQAFANDATKFVNLTELQFIDTSKNLVKAVDNRLIGINIFPKYTVQPVSIGSGSNELLGLVVDVSTALDLALPLSQTSEELNLADLYAVTKECRKIVNGQVCFSSLQGRIKYIENNIVHFSDNSNTCNAKNCFLEPSKVNRKYLVKSLVGTDSENVQRRIDQIITQKVSGYNRYEAIMVLINHLSKQKEINCVQNFKFSADNNLVQINRNFSRASAVERPTFVFDPEKTKTDTWANRGLITNGPFDSAVFYKKNPKFVILFPESRYSEVNRFLTLFENGDGSSYFGKGFVKKYRLENVHFDISPFDLDIQNISKSYENACLNALAGDSNYDLAIIFIEKRFHSPLFKSDPYLIAKSIFMSYGVPVQEIELETLSKYGLSYSLDNIGLACYAKLGGIPWTIASSNNVDHKLVIGLGSSIIRDSRLSQISRYVGITAVFGSDGNYLFSNLSNEIEYADYSRELTKSVKQVVSEVAKRQAWAKGESLRLVIHQTFKGFTNKEVNSIKNAVSEIGDFATDFSFVTIGHNHPFTLFDLNQQSPKGSYIPERGSIIPNQDNSALLTVIGSKQMITASSFPKPLSISVHKESTFNDVEQLTKQVYHFTALSWRAFNPTYVPVTILYSDLIANLMGRLRTVKNWNANIIQSKLRYSRWFL